MGTNHKPTIRGTDNAIWRRIKLIPFNVTIPLEEQDKALGGKLLTELPGILAWAVRGCLDWQRDGLDVSDDVRQATQMYRNEMDEIGRFIEQCCVENPVAIATKADLHDAYVRWGGDLTKRRLGQALRERGFEDDRGTGGTWHWKGVGLLVKGDNDDKK